ncbi:TIGR03089 family protein [Mycobacterium sp. SMC-4]|uniref:TIGR03089 family protein n=1 Tax=Mycobacterium sp. SMC-4 TaxID=2857059 RepID=UPI0021B1BE98|nr:TIGR03089 family protein [Mycobacterium sp. SMC-4]UXA19309.1 TIGR03089 family protein [Mycobacterium sp. SMC-4]
MTNVSSAILDPLLANNPAGPRITYYDDATGERIECSTATLANWAAKTANLLRDELGAGPGSRVAVLLPAHWQTAAVLFGVWWIGAEVVLGGEADIALCTADRLDEADASVGMGEVAVLSLDPFGKPAPDLPVGVTDYATSVRVHGDQIVPETAPGAALEGRSANEVLAAAQATGQSSGFSATDRVLSVLAWNSADDIVERLLSVYATGASLVQVANSKEDLLARHSETERVTRTLR